MTSIKGKFESLKTAFQKIRAGCDHYNLKLLRAVASVARLYALEKFSLKEIIGYALYVPKIRQDIPVLISKERSLGKLATRNPPALQNRTEDKMVFYEVCRAANLPIPANYGIFRNGRGVDADQNTLSASGGWLSFFDAKLPTHFIVKDVSGVYGSGFAAFERIEGKFKEVNGSVLDTGKLYDRLCEHRHSRLILQERLFNHASLAALSASGGLLTLRVNTDRSATGAVSVLFYILKVPTGNNITDNFAMGTTGNLIAFGDSNDGVLRGARTLHPSGSGLVTIHTHPDTGTSLDGFRIPMWQEAVDLAKTAHQSFPEFGCLGWDLALTAHGPRVLEANIWWDPPTYAPQIMSCPDWERLFR